MTQDSDQRGLGSPAHGRSREVDEQREHRRMVPSGVSSSEGRVIDLSKGGAQLLVDGEMGCRPKDRFDVVLSSEDQHIPLCARVAWIEQVAHRQYVIGLAFTYVSEDLLDSLEQMIRLTCGGYAEPICYLAA